MTAMIGQQRYCDGRILKVYSRIRSDIMCCWRIDIDEGSVLGGIEKGVSILAVVEYGDETARRIL